MVIYLDDVFDAAWRFSLAVEAELEDGATEFCMLCDEPLPDDAIFVRQEVCDCHIPQLEAEMDAYEDELIAVAV